MQKSYERCWNVKIENASDKTRGMGKSIIWCCSQKYVPDMHMYKHVVHSSKTCWSCFTPVWRRECISSEPVQNQNGVPKKVHKTFACFSPATMKLIYSSRPSILNTCRIFTLIDHVKTCFWKFQDWEDKNCQTRIIPLVECSYKQPVAAWLRSLFSYQEFHFIGVNEFASSDRENVHFMGWIVISRNSRLCLRGRFVTCS